MSLLRGTAIVPSQLLNGAQRGSTRTDTRMVTWFGVRRVPTPDPGPLPDRMTVRTLIPIRRPPPRIETP
jgi:hypothetical protein